MKWRHLTCLVSMIGILLLNIQVTAANEMFKEIYEVDSVPVTEEDIEALSDHETVEASDDFSIPDSRLSSIDINDRGELLVCFTDKIVVFDKKLELIKACEITWGKGGVPFAIWNKQSNNIVYMRGSGYEFNEDGVIFLEYYWSM